MFALAALLDMSSGHCEGLGQARLGQFVYGWLARTRSRQLAPTSH